MVPPTIFVSGGVAVLQLCKEIYVRYRNVKRFRRDCAKLAHFVHRIETFIAATEDDCDMTEPGWQEAFSALHEALLEVVHVFEKCANFGMLRSMINADELNLKLNSISQRLMLALQLIPIQKAKATDKRLIELTQIQQEIRSATFAAVAAAEEQSAALKRLMDQCTVDASKTQEMLQQVLLLLQTDQPARVRLPAGACTGPTPDGDGDSNAQQQQQLRIDLAQLEAEVEDLQAEQQCALRDKDVVEQQYLEQIIAVITAMESQLQQQQPDGTSTAPTASPPAAAEVPVDLRCPITYQLLRDPVILADSGQTYERAAIEEWLSRGNMRDPITGAQLSSNVLVANVLVRKLAQEWQEAHPSYKEDAAVEPTAGAQGGTSSSASCFQQQQGSLEGEEGDDGYCVWEDGLDVDPKTAAILAASTSAGLSTTALKPGAGAAAGDFPALFAGSSGSSNNMQGQFAGDGEDDKEAAQRSYARAVAAAAAAEAQMFVVAPAFMQAAGAAPPAAAAGHGGDGTGSNNSSRCSSITFARATSSRSLPSITDRRAPSTELRLHSVPSGAAGLQPHSSMQLGMWPSVSLAQPAPSIPEHQQQPQSLAAAAGSSNHTSAAAAAAAVAAPAEHAPAPVRGAGEDVARRLGLTGSESRRLSTSSSRQERTAAAQAAAAAIAQGQHGPFNLEKLHRTLGHAAEVRYRLAARDSSAAAAEEMKVQQQQMQQERDQQRNRAFLQQHVDTVLRSQSPLRQQQLSISPSGEAYLQQQQPGGSSSSNRALQSSVSMCAVPPSQQHQAARGGASTSSQHQSGAPPAAALRHCQSVPSAAMQGAAASYSALQHSASRSSPSVPPSVRSVASSTRSSASAAEPVAPAPRRGLSGFMMGRSGRRTSDVDAASVADRDDIASVSSTGSGDSRRSVGKSMMGVLKSIKYSMVYEDDKC